jgi:hypothetical protein
MAMATAMATAMVTAITTATATATLRDRKRNSDRGPTADHGRATDDAALHPRRTLAVAVVPSHFVLTVTLHTTHSAHRDGAAAST